MLIRPHTLSLITTHKCTAACANCCFGCTPQRSEAIPHETIVALIEQAAEIPSIKVVVFTGGECFLLGERLDQYVGLAAKRGFLPRFVSNGYWATSLPSALKRLRRLADVGLKEACYSTGDCHREYVKPQFVRNGANAAAELGLNTSVMVEVHNQAGFILEDFLEEDPLFKKNVDEGRIILRVSPWMDFGDSRATVDHNDEYKSLIRKISKPCHTVLEVLSVTPTMQLFACCGLPMEEIPELAMADIATDKRSLKEIIDAEPNDLVKVWLHTEGPEAIINHAKKVAPDLLYDVPGNAAHICSICKYLYGNTKLIEAVLANPPEEVDDIFRVLRGV